jgi:hypothetical protein
MNNIVKIIKKNISNGNIKMIKNINNINMNSIKKH